MFTPPMGNTIDSLSRGTGIETVENNDRIVRNDPRESFWWTLPNKLTPQQCLQMLRAALAGDLFQQFNLCQLMLDTWPTFRMASHQLMESAAYMRYAVHPFAEEGKKPSPRAQEKADLVSRAIRGMTPNSFNDEKGFSGMAYNLCDAMLNGLSLTELLWKPVATSDHGREWMPVSSAWVHPRHYTFSTAGNITLYTDDSDRINSGVLGYRPGQIPDEDKFVCGQFISKAGSSLGAGFMRPLVWYWSARQFNNEWMLNTAKQYGSPFIDITYKPGTVSTGPNSELEKLNEMLKTAGAQRRLLHPEGTTAVIHQPSSLGKENPQRVLEEKADEACLFLLLGQKGTTTAVSGQLGNDDSHENVKEERKLGVANWLARNPLRQFARAVLRKNYGNDDECPNIEPDTTKPLKPEQVGAMMSSVSSSRVPVRADEFYKKLGFTQPEAGEVVMAGGEIMIQPEPMTQEEKFDQQLEQQVQQGEAQIALQGESEQGQPPAKASERVNIRVIKAGAPEGNQNAKKVWKVKYVHLDDRAANRPFFKRSVYSHGENKNEAIDRVKDHHGNSSSYGEFRASPAEEGKKADYQFEDRSQATDLTLRDVLIHATDAELHELEEKLTAAETAQHRNGEIKELESAVAELESRKRF